MPVDALKPGTRLAKQAYLYGEGDGRRVGDIKRLAEIGGVHPQTIRDHLPAWEKEAERMLAGTTELGMQLILSAASLETHRINTEFLGNLAKELREELETLPKLIKELRKTLAWFREHGEKEQIQDALAVFQAFTQGVGARKVLQAQYIQAEKAWKENAGIDSLQSVAETREKTLAAGRARLQIAAEKPPETEALPVAQPGGRPGVFDLGEPVAVREEGWDDGI